MKSLPGLLDLLSKQEQESNTHGHFQSNNVRGDDFEYLPATRYTPHIPFRTSSSHQSLKMQHSMVRLRTPVKDSSDISVEPTRPVPALLRSPIKTSRSTVRQRHSVDSARQSQMNLNLGSTSDLLSIHSRRGSSKYPGSALGQRQSSVRNPTSVTGADYETDISEDIFLSRVQAVRTRRPNNAAGGESKGASYSKLMAVGPGFKERMARTRSRQESSGRRQYGSSSRRELGTN